MESPLVSIVTPSYNSEKYIFTAIKSVQNQSYPHWEMVIVDDCSTDNTTRIIDNLILNDSRIKCYRLEKNAGPGVARQQALQMAKGRFIAFLDSDDLWKPEKLEKQLAYLISNDVPFTFSFYDCIDEEGNALGKRIEAPRTLTYFQLFFCNFVGNLTGIYDVEYFGKIPISGIRKRQDWMVWLTIMKKIRKAKPVPESLAFYRIRENSVSSSKIGLLGHNYTVYRLFHKLNMAVSLLCMAGFLFTQLLIKPQYIKKIRPTK